MSLPEGAIVHIIEVDNTDSPIIANRVFVNGVDIGLIKSFRLQVGSLDEGTATQLMLELLPRQVIIGGEAP